MQTEHLVTTTDDKQWAYRDGAWVDVTPPAEPPYTADLIWLRGRAASHHPDTMNTVVTIGQLRRILGYIDQQEGQPMPAIGDYRLPLSHGTEPTWVTIGPIEVALVGIMRPDGFGPAAPAVTVLARRA